MHQPLPFFLRSLAAALLLISLAGSSRAVPPGDGAWIEISYDSEVMGRVYITAEHDGSSQFEGCKPFALHLVALTRDGATIEIRRLGDARETVYQVRAGELLQTVELRQGEKARPTDHNPALALRLVRAIPANG
ncbi:MAG: hypothetical protein AAF604_06900 [Acidobacteriota bacterium]